MYVCPPPLPKQLIQVGTDYVDDFFSYVPERARSWTILLILITQFYTRSRNPNLLAVALTRAIHTLVLYMYTSTDQTGHTNPV